MRIFLSSKSSPYASLLPALFRHPSQLSDPFWQWRCVAFAAATPNLTYDCDTHYPWTQSDVIKGRKLSIDNGTVKVPKSPGLGVEIDQDPLAQHHDLYLSQNLRDREDTDEMLKYIPDYKRVVPRW